MIDHSIPVRLAEPPPAFDLALMDGDLSVGFITPRSIGFAGFASDTEAAHAAWAAHRLVSWRRAARAGGRPVPVDIEPLSLRHGDRIEVEASGKAFAELRPPADGRDTWAFVLPLPEPLPQVFVQAKAHAVYRMLRRSGIRWALFARPARPERPRVEVPQTLPATSPHWFEAVVAGLDALRRRVSVARFRAIPQGGSHVEHPV